MGVKSDKIKYTLYEGEDLFFTHTFKVSPDEIIFLHTLEFDRLNEAPEIELQIETGGKTVQKNIRIKPKNFFNKLTFVEQINNEAYLFSFILDTEKKVEQNDLQFEVNHDQLRYSMQNRMKTEKSVLHNQPAERVVDLHIEKITKDYKNLSNNEIVEIQLSYFQRALNAALRSHLDHMYVIHGLGKGVLKNRVFDILKTYTGIKEFKNDYHPRFGWGATEIIFK
jgi:dsDNA-specific endonuclease/ATPase MutS2